MHQHGVAFVGKAVQRRMNLGRIRKVGRAAQIERIERPGAGGPRAARGSNVVLVAFLA